LRPPAALRSLRLPLRPLVRKVKSVPSRKLKGVCHVNCPFDM
jgi:hypothetical protein